MKTKWPWVLLTRGRQAGALGASRLLERKRAGRSGGGCTVGPRWTLQSQAAGAPGKLGQLATHCCWPPSSLRARAVERGEKRREGAEISIREREYSKTTTRLEEALAATGGDAQGRKQNSAFFAHAPTHYHYSVQKMVGGTGACVCVCVCH